jgi:hypothetical protein
MGGKILAEVEYDIWDGYQKRICSGEDILREFPCRTISGITSFRFSVFK